jgi:nucleotide-binding universal stress UspA family protein
VPSAKRVSPAEKTECAMLTLRTILHPTDFSEPSAWAFRLACSLARDHGAGVHVFHVGREPVVCPLGGVVPPEPEGYEEGLREQLLAIRADDPNVPVEHVLRFAGAPAAEIVQAARQLGADLVVMGIHGRSGLGRLLLGSVAEEVLRRAHCPVLTVRAPLPRAGSAEPSAGQAAAAAAGAEAR